MKFIKGDLSIQLLQNINEFKEEGEELEHCVYVNEYYAKDKSMIFSARVQGKRTETIELNLKTFKIMQSRGLRNSNTPYHSAIVELLNSNIKKIQKVMQQNASQKTNPKNQAA